MKPTPQHNNQEELGISISEQEPDSENASLLPAHSPRHASNRLFSPPPIKHRQRIAERLKDYRSKSYCCPSLQLGFSLVALGGIITAIILLKSRLDKLHQEAATTFDSHRDRYHNLYYTCESPLLECAWGMPFDRWPDFCWPKGMNNGGWLKCCFDELIATCNDDKHYNRLIDVTEMGEVLFTLFGMAALIVLGLAVRNIHSAYQNNQLPLPKNETENIDELTRPLNTL